MQQQLTMDELTTADVLRMAHERKTGRGKRVRGGKQSPEDVFDLQLRQFCLPPYERQLMFAKQAMGRRWQFDFAWPQYKLAVEIEGLVVQRINGQLVVRGRHASITGFKADCEKYNTAILLGWQVMRFEQSQVKPRHALGMLMHVLAAKGWKGQGAVTVEGIS